MKNIETAFEIMPAIVKERVAAGNLSWYSLPNVNELLSKLVGRNDVKLGILTGNLYDIAMIKLETAGINPDHFKEKDGRLFGAFGSDAFARDELVRVARRRYSELLGQAVEPNDLVIIGDSPKDISCAHNNGSPCIAVDTGFFDAQQLGHADFVLQGGFKGLDLTVKALVETMHEPPEVEK